MKQLNILVKPVSSICNLDCKYCFYKRLNPKQNLKIMDQVVSRALVDNAVASEYQEININFQGGEPSLAGIEFFKNFIDYANKVKGEKKINYTFQTNGILINQQWIELFLEHNILVGISIDAFERVHNSNRGEGTFNKVISAMKLLKRNGVEFNTLVVLTRQLLPYSKEVYKFFKDNELVYIQIIPCIDETNEFSITPNEYSQFHIDIYKMWFEEYQNNFIRYINVFDNALHILGGEDPTTCGGNGFCQLQFVVEVDGSVYPCDFYVGNESLVGNIVTTSFKELSSKILLSGFLKKAQLSEICNSCEFKVICNGGCKKMHLVISDDVECGYQKLLQYIAK